VDCGLVYVSPQPVRDELARFYEAMYGDETGSESLVAPGFVEAHLRAIVQDHRPRGGRLLEIGCGRGRFLERMAQLPWELHGIELSPTAAQEARRRVPSATVECRGLDDATFPSETFDCIVMIAVLEHVKDPAAVLQRVVTWLAPGGLLIVQVPYVAPYFRLKRWFPWLPIFFEAPRHLFDFSPVTLSRYFEKAGFKAVRFEIARPYSSPTRIGLALIWGVKLFALAVYHLSGQRCIFPFSAAIVALGVKEAGND
jgi:SAM-dependent methyltransferase